MSRFFVVGLLALADLVIVLLCVVVLLGLVVIDELGERFPLSVYAWKQMR